MINAKVTSQKMKEESAKQELKFEIRSNWNEMLYYQSLITILDTQIAIWQNVSEKMNKRYEVGDANFIEKTTAEMHLEQLRQEQLFATATLQQLQGHILVLINAPTAVSLKSTFIAKVNFILNTDSTALVNNPLLQLVNQEVEIAKKQKLTNRAKAFPDITLGYFIQSFKGELLVDGQPVNYNGTPRFQGFTVGLSIPVFSKAYKANTAAANTTILLEQEHAELVKNQLEQQLKTQLHHLFLLDEQLNYYENTALKNAVSLRESSALGYAQGDISYADYSSALEIVNSTKKNYLQTVRHYNQNVYEIKYLVNQ